MAWIDQGWQPTYLGFAPSEAAWDTQMKRMKVVGESYPDSPGNCSRFTGTGMGADVIIVTLNREAWMGVSVISRVGIIVHEATHVWQYICENAGIKAPDKETEAYSIMAITQGLLSAVRQCWRIGVDWKEAT